MDDAGYIFAAFGAMWVVIFVYILYLSYQQRTLKREIESLESRIGKEDTE